MCVRVRVGVGAGVGVCVCIYIYTYVCMGVLIFMLQQVPAFCDGQGLHGACIRFGM